MKAYDYLTRPELNEEEEQALFAELASAYRADEQAVDSIEVRHLIERIRGKMNQPEVEEKNRDSEGS